MSISRDEYTYLCEQEVPYQGEVEDLGEAYSGYTTVKYSANQADSFYKVDSVNICVAIDTSSLKVNISAALETMITAEENRLRKDVLLKMEELKKTLAEKDVATKEALLSKSQEALINKPSTEKSTAKKNDTDQKAINAAQWLETVTKEYAYVCLADKTRVDRSQQLREIEAMLAMLTSDDNSVQKALKAVEEYIGKVKYKNETGLLRTDTTEEALEYMDCTEFAARFLQMACGLEKVPAFSSEMLAKAIKDNKDFGGYLQHIKGSDSNDFTDIQPGDIFLWRRSNEGHVGVVVSYDAAKDQVTILESLTRGAERSLNGGKNELTNQLRRSTYTRLGKALYGHEGWKGYFRPINKKK